MIKLVERTAVWILALLIACGAPCFAEDDVIFTKNGDRITGEITLLDQGVIHIDPSYGENVFQIDWDEVERVESQRSYVIETTGGLRVSGSLGRNPDNPQQLVIEDDAGPVVVERLDVVAARPFDIGFWNRMDVNVDLGMTFTKANNSKQASLNGRASYEAEGWQLRGGANLLRNTIGEEQTVRSEANVDYRRIVGQRWFGLVGAEFLQSEELQLDLRTTVAPGVGRFLKRTNRVHWAIAGGAQWINERFSEPDLPSVGSAEAWAGTEIYLFDLEDVSWLTRVKVSPGLTEFGRVRIDLKTDFEIDLPKDLYFRIGLQENFDSRPSTDAPKSDYVFSMGVGWEL